MQYEKEEFILSTFRGIGFDNEVGASLEGYVVDIFNAAHIVIEKKSRRENILFMCRILIISQTPNSERCMIS